MSGDSTNHYAAGSIAVEELEAIDRISPAPEPRIEAGARTLTSGRLLARNTLWNLAGQIAPLAIAVYAIPRLIHALGTDRFGALTIAWMVVGYFSFFDLGLGRAMTNLVAQNLATDSQRELPAIVWTANLLMGLLGIVGAASLALLSPMLVKDVLRTPQALQAEMTSAVFILSISIPFVISTAGFRGILEARQKFRVINLLRFPMGVATFAAPLLVLPWSQNLVAVISTLLAVRIAFWFAYATYALRDMPVLWHTIAVDFNMVPKLFSYGAWMTVSNIVSPVMAYMDRFFVGALLSLTAVAYYATPWELATKLLIVPGAIVGVLFPAFSTALVMDRSHARILFQRAVKYVFLILFPATLLIAQFAQIGLTVWLGQDFAGHSFRVMQWLAIGILANSLANLPYALIQGAARPDITGKLHLAELPLYLILVGVLTKHLGIEGTAIAWAVRMIIDCGLLFAMADRLLGKTLRFRTVLIGSVALAASFALAMASTGVAVKCAVAGVEVLAYFLISWFLLLAVDERSALLRFFVPASPTSSFR